MSTTALASPLTLPSPNPNVPSFHVPTNQSSLPFIISSSPLSLKLHAKPFSFRPRDSSRFARKVTLSSSEFDQEEEQLSNGGEQQETPDLKLFVGNLPFGVDSAQLAALFQNAGSVEMVEVIYDKVTGRSRGFGFVTMSTPEEIEAAAQQFNGYELEGRQLRVNYGQPPQRKSSSSRGNRSGGGTVNSVNRVYVGNISWGVDNLALESLFSEQGNVLDAKVIYDRESGRSRGFGYVTYTTAEEVENAIESLNGVELDGRAIRVSLAEARPRR